MTWLAILIVVASVSVAFMILQVPHRTLRLMEEADARRARIADLDVRHGRLSQMRSQTRQIVEGALGGLDSGLSEIDVDLLKEMRAECQSLLVGLHEVSPILERYFRQQIAIIDMVLGEAQTTTPQGPTSGQVIAFVDAVPVETRATSSWAEVLQSALNDLNRYQTAEASTNPIALLERSLATGRDLL